MSKNKKELMLTILSKRFTELAAIERTSIHLQRGVCPGCNGKLYARKPSR